jgi:hypothetical protein
MSKSDHEILSGGCLCGGVRYQLTGACRDIINCHCENCRRTHGHIAAYTSVNRSDLALVNQQTLQWYHDESPDTYRGFCNRCGASLFWDARDDRGKVAVSAGSLDDSGELKTIGHVYVSEAAKYYQINDELPRFETSNSGALESDESG